MSNLLVIFGATGKQGGSVIASILSDPSTASKYKLRGVTRDPSKASAQALSAKGVEMVSGDLDDKASLEKVVEGAYGVFAVTDFWASMDAEKELQQGKNIVDAAKKAGVQHFVLSTLLSPKEFTNGALSKVAHFDSKAAFTSYATSVGLPSTFYLPGFYMQNLPGQMFRKDESSGAWIFALPIAEDAQIPLIDIEADTGKYVKAIFENKDQWMGKEVYGSGKYYTPLEVVATFKKVYPGQQAQFVSIPREAFTGAMEGMGMPHHIAEGLMETMVLLNKEYGYYNGADLAESQKLIDDLAVTWESFVKSAPAWKGLQ